MNENFTKNVLIRASAGTGKTFAIATRFILLFVVEKCSPSSILALTFSRLAAQEIYTKILERLWRAAASEEGAAKEKATLLEAIFGENSSPSEENIARVLKGRALNANDFSNALRELVNKQHLGTIATLDSFILKFVQSYSLELGFQNSITLLDEFQEKQEINDAQNNLLSTRRANAAIQDAFNALKPNWSRNCRNEIRKLCNDVWRKFVSSNSANLPTIKSMCEVFDVPENLECFSEKNPPTSAKINIEEIAKSAMRDGKSHKAAGKTVAENLSLLRETLSNYDGANFLFFKSKSLLKDLLKTLRLTTLTSGAAFTFGKSSEVYLPLEFLKALQLDVKKADNLFLLNLFTKSVKRLELVAIFERAYNKRASRAGLLTFSALPDAQSRFEWAQNPIERETMIENLSYRFDSKFDHWALDEFQDTNDVQWACLKPLVENAAIDPEKSVIAVGDLKQAIYNWRGGSRKPFCELMNWQAMCGEQNGKPIFIGENSRRIGAILDKDISRRYEKNICDFINLIFCRNNLQAAFIENDRKDALEYWLSDSCWREHTPLIKNGVPLSNDCVKVIGVNINVDDEKEFGVLNEDGEETKDLYKKDVSLISSELINEVKTLWKKREDARSRETVGILVRSNDQGAAIAKLLRKEHLPVIWEGMSLIRNTPIVELVLALLTLSQHPDDSAAWGFIQASPLPRWLEEKIDLTKNVEDVSQEIAKKISREGLARTVQCFVLPVQRALNEIGDNATLSNLTSLVRAAVKFESFSKTIHDIDAFKKYLDSNKERELAASSDFIRILTIHRSKGLGIDHLVVPLLETERTNFYQSSSSATIQDETAAKWILPDVSESIKDIHPLLTRAWLAKQNEIVSENLHIAYVALTRAKKSLTVITPILWKITNDEPCLKNNGFSYFVLSALDWTNFSAKKTLLAQWGDDAKFAPSEKTNERIKPTPFSVKPRVSQEAVKRVAPSSINKNEHVDLEISKSLFDESFSNAKQIGIDLHNELAKIEWLEKANNKMEEVFLKPTADATLWREKAYEIYRNGVWVSGVIDRVVFYTENGKRKAIISDFKSTEETNDDILINRYRNQLLAYRDAVHALTGIEKEEITMQLVVPPERIIRAE